MIKARILVVEDEAIIAMEIESTLQNLGYEVISVETTGLKAIEKVETTNPDIILMDIRIKGEMDGIETAEIIRSRFGIPVIFSTAYLDEDRIERAKITMPFGYILKPIQERDLKVTVEMALYVAEIDKERKKAEEYSREQASFLHTIMEQSPFAMWIADHTGTIIKANKVMRRSLHLHEQKLVGRYNVLEDENLIEQGVMPEIQAVFEQLKPAQICISWDSTKAGTVLFETQQSFWAEASFFPIKDKKGDLKHVICQWVDTTRQKQAERVLQESETRIRAKLETILSPTGDLGRLNLADIINVPELQVMMDEFYRLTTIGIAIIDLEGNVLVKTGWQDVCVNFHRVHPKTRQHCLESDMELSKKVEPGTYKMYRCMNNMWDMVTPIMIGNHHLGNLFLGQFFFDDETPDFDVFRQQAEQYGFDWNDYKAALERVPVWSREKVDAAMTFYTRLAAMISKLSYSNLKLAHLLHTQNGNHG